MKVDALDLLAHAHAILPDELGAQTIRPTARKCNLLGRNDGHKA